MQSRYFCRLLGLVLAVGSIPSVGRADAVGAGTLSIFGSMNIAPTSISFTGNTATVSGIGNTGVFAGLGNTTVTIANVTGNPPASIAQWITTTNGISFELTGLAAGTGTMTGCASNAPGSVCTPIGSPLTITETGLSQSTLSFTADGNAYAGLLAGGSSPFTAVFTSQFNESITALLADALDGLPGTYSAVIVVTPSVSATPEPGTLISSMTGLLLVGWRVADRKRWMRRN